MQGREKYSSSLGALNENETTRLQWYSFLSLILCTGLQQHAQCMGSGVLINPSPSVFGTHHQNNRTIRHMCG